MFPLLRICVKKYPIITWGVATIIYIVVVVYNPFKISLTRNLLIRGYDFLFGMLIVRYMPKNIDRKKQMSISLLFACIFIFGIGYQVADYRLKMCVITMTGISLFLFLIILLEKLDIGRFYFVKIVNKYSYDIFLLHHITLSLCFLYFAGHKYSLFEGATLTIIYIISLVIFIKSGRFIKGKIAMYFNQIVDF